MQSFGISNDGYARYIKQAMVDNSSLLTDKIGLTKKYMIECKQHITTEIEVWNGMPRLYTLTKKKQSLISDIECTVRDRVDDLYSRLTAIKLDKLEGGNANLHEYEKENAMYRECWQVVIAVMFHTNEIFRPRNAQWNTEFDVPYEIFERAILNIMSKMKWYCENPIIKDKQRYLDFIELLEDILWYRKKFETA